MHARIAQLDGRMQALQRAAEQVTQTILIVEVFDEAWAAFKAAERQELVLILVEKIVVNEPAVSSTSSSTTWTARSTVRAGNLVHGSDQQGCSLAVPAVMITDHVPAVRIPPDYARRRGVAAVAA